MRQLSNGIWIPDKGQSVYDWTVAESGIPNLLMDAVESLGKQLNSVIHAGGNIGLYTLDFAKRAKNVYVFEPENESFSALSMNCAEKNNIFLYKAALGNSHTSISLTNDEDDNWGTWRVDNKHGDVPTLLIDDLNLSDVSIIHLDIEGYELFALEGAEQTIRRCEPLIAFEIMQHNKKYNYEHKDLFNFVTKMGYNSYCEYSHEIMFVKK